MRKEDFAFDHKDEEYQDYWFNVSGETADELADKHMEMCMVGVTEVVYSKVEDFVGVKCLFPFNYHVVTSDDPALKEMMLSLIEAIPG